MRIGVPKEIRTGEARVGLAPDVIGKLVKQGLEVFIESGAGLLSGFPDKQYLDSEPIKESYLRHKSVPFDQYAVNPRPESKYPNSKFVIVLIIVLLIVTANIGPGGSNNNALIGEPISL